MNFPKQLFSSLGLAIPLAMGAPALQAQTVMLKFTHFLPSTSNFQKNVAEPWCAAIEKDSAAVSLPVSFVGMAMRPVSVCSHTRGAQRA